MAIDASFPESPQQAAISASPDSGACRGGAGVSNGSSDTLPKSSNRRMLKIFYPSRSKLDPVWLDRLFLLFSIAMWYLIGVGAVVSTKLLLTDWNVPPLLLTFQQLVAASSLLRIVIALRPSRVQPLPWEWGDENFGAFPTTKKLGFIWQNHSDFVLAGLFNALDFLCSNTAFSASAASFVETIKSSDPITTTAVALAWNVDQLGRSEAVALSLLIVGVLLSTWGNSQSSSRHYSSAVDDTSLQESIRGVTIVMIANLCFAFRAMFQKRYGSVAAEDKLDDVNLLCRMQQTGALALLGPVMVGCSGFVLQALQTLPHHAKLYYLGLSAFNASCYAVYNLASTYILTKLTVLQHSSLNCLRRMFAIIVTCAVFGVPVTLLSALGLLTSFVGFVSFTLLRNRKQPRQSKGKTKASIV